MGCIMSQEIKINKEDFEKTITMLTNHMSNLKKTKEKFCNINNNMKQQWIGAGGTAFLGSSEIVEKKFEKVINDICDEISDLDLEKQSMFKEDKYLGEGYMKK